MARTRRTILWFIVAIALALLAFAWHDWVGPNVLPKRFGVIQDGMIYRSGKLTPAASRLVTRKHNIKTIIDLGAYERGSRKERLEQRTADALGITRYRFDLVGDATGNPNAYLQTLRMMTDPRLQPVLVHCGAGTERTGCAAALYEHIVLGVSLDDAYEHAKQYGHSTRRNPHLREMLDKWAQPIARAYLGDGPVQGAEPLANPPEPVSSGAE
jgi:protein tyrosine/serine phosphatase